MTFLYDARAAAKALSMGRTRLFAEIARGKLNPLQRHPKVLFHRDELERYAAALRDEQSPAATRKVLGIDPHFNAEVHDD